MAESQSTHPCGVRRPPGADEAGPKKVSIHAPLRGATFVIDELRWEEGVSIHAPLRGATCVSSDFLGFLQRFNPRTPAGCDKKHLHSSVNHASFNPRTPAGCDLAGITPSPPIRSFNPRTPAGCDAEALVEKVAQLEFQSTHPCGVRLKLPEPEVLRQNVSIHAPLRGATSRRRTICTRRRRFNPRTPAGCD